MTRPQAIDRVRKLRALTEERGATPAEAQTSSGRAQRLIERFELTEAELAIPRTVRPLLPPQPGPFGFGMPTDPLAAYFRSYFDAQGANRTAAQSGNWATLRPVFFR